MTAASGIDVSYYQQQINWAQVAATGKKFAIIRATLGSTYTDPYYAANENGARNAGIAPGAYHVYKPSQDIQTQANHFYSVVGKLHDGDVIPWIDAELFEPLPDEERVNMYDLAQKLAELIVACERKFGSKVGIYTGAWWWNQLPAAERANPRWQGPPKWFASYTNTPGTVTKPYGFTTYDIHQYTSSGRVSGINGNVDLNYCPNIEAILHHVSPPDDWKGKVAQRVAAIRAQLGELEDIVRKA